MEGKIELRQNILTIGPNAKIKAQVFAKAVVVQGEVHGNVTATEKVDIRDAGSVDGDISAPRVAIADGAHFRGSIDMQRQGGAETGDKPRRPTADGNQAAGAVGATSGTPHDSGPLDRTSWCVRMKAGPLTALFKRGLRKPSRRPRASPAAAGHRHDFEGLSAIPERGVQQPAPVLLDLGPVVGSNVTFFGDRFACKIHVEDLVAEVESHARRGERAKLDQSFEARLRQLPESVDGILCWDLFDFLDRPRRAGPGRPARAHVAPGRRPLREVRNHRGRSHHLHAIRRRNGGPAAGAPLPG